MDRHLDTSGAASAPTAPVNVMGPNFYPQGGISPSLPGPWWFHMVTEEMRAVVVAGGLTPDRIVLNQLASAISAMIVAQAPQLPAGTILHVSQATAPTGYLKANGATVSRTTYAALFASIGTTFGAGDGSTTFGLPDLRGEFIRGYDDGRGVDTGRALGSAQADEIKAHDHPMTYYGSGGWSGCGATGYPQESWGTSCGTNANAIQNTGGAETRPRNIALLACIKY